MQVWVVETMETVVTYHDDVYNITNAIHVFGNQDAASWFVTNEIAQLPKMMNHHCYAEFSHIRVEGDCHDRIDTPIYKYTSKFLDGCVNRKESERAEFEFETWWSTRVFEVAQE